MTCMFEIVERNILVVTGNSRSLITQLRNRTDSLMELEELLSRDARLAPHGGQSEANGSPPSLH